MAVCLGGGKQVTWRTGVEDPRIAIDKQLVSWSSQCQIRPNAACAVLSAQPPDQCSSLLLVVAGDRIWNCLTALQIHKSRNHLNVVVEMFGCRVAAPNNVRLGTGARKPALEISQMQFPSLRSGMGRPPILAPTSAQTPERSHSADRQLRLKYPLIARRHQLPPAHGPAQGDIAGLQSPALIRATSDSVS